VGGESGRLSSDGVRLEVGRSGDMMSWSAFIALVSAEKVGSDVGLLFTVS
jgi:hypothetical protein